MTDGRRESERYAAAWSGGLAEADGLTILVHVGPHKTGTTWLQDRFLAGSRDIVFAGDFRLTHRAFLTPRIDEFSPTTVRDCFAPSLRRARDSGRPLVISDEALGGRPFHQRFVREVAALRIRAAFPDARILIGAREQDALLHSMYGEYLRYGYSSTLRGFLARDTGNLNILPLLDHDFYRFDRTHEFYARLFGVDRVSVVPMEWMLADVGRFAGWLSSVLGHEVGAPDGADAAVVSRPAWSGWARTALRLGNRLVPQDTRQLRRSGRLSPNSVAFQVDRFTPAGARRTGNARDRAIVRGMVGSYYAASNARLARMSGFDLAALGYVVAPPDTPEAPSGA
jgi:hypothetical protein